MSETNCTEGNWEHDGDGWIVSRTKPICVLDPRSKTFMGDANMIAAAKDMYQLLTELRGEFNCGCGHPGCSREAQQREIDELLDKARGERVGQAMSEPKMDFREGSRRNWRSRGASLTKREYFAGLAMQGILANKCYEPPRRQRLVGMADDAVAAADALLAELDKDQES